MEFLRLIMDVRSFQGKVELSLSKSQALVLFDGISRFNDDDSNTFADQAEQRILWDLEASLEAKLVEVVSGNYEDAITTARRNVRD